MLAYRQNLALSDENVVQLSTPKVDLESEICRLWQARWSGRKIAEHLGIAAHKVGNVVYKNGLARNPRVSRHTEEPVAVSLQDAPVEAWQQAMLPELEQAADGVGAAGVLKRAFVFACLLRLKDYDDLMAFADWAQHVTGYAATEISDFVERAIAGFIIVDGQPSAKAFEAAETVESGGDIALTLIAGVIEGTFERTTDDRYSLVREPSYDEVIRWEGEGGHLLEAA